MQNTIDITETMKVTQAAVAKTVREAADSARAVREAPEDAEERRKKGIQPIVIPTSEEAVAAKKRVAFISH